MLIGAQRWVFLGQTAQTENYNGKRRLTFAKYSINVPNHLIGSKPRSHGLSSSRQKHQMLLAGRREILVPCLTKNGEPSKNGLWTPDWV